MSRENLSYSLIEEYHKKFIDTNTGRMFEHLAEHKDCPICNSSSKTHILDKSASTYFKCNNCSMVYLSPVLNKLAIIDYYKHLNTGQGEIVGRDKDFYTEIYSMGLDYIEKYNMRMRRMLDS